MSRLQHAQNTDTGTSEPEFIIRGLKALKETGAFSGLTKITVGKTQPASPSIGDLWIDTN